MTDHRAAGRKAARTKRDPAKEATKRAELSATPDLEEVTGLSKADLPDMDGHQLDFLKARYTRLGGRRGTWRAQRKLRGEP